MKRHIQVLGAVFVVLLFSCDRERDNPIDPNSSLLFLRPLTPVGLSADGGVGLVLLSWQPVVDRDLAGYALYRSDTPDGAYELIPGNTGSEKPITTGKTSYTDSVNIQPGATLFYRVAAVDKDGFVSILSPFIGVTVEEDKVAPGAPQNLSAVAGVGGENLVQLRWSAPLEDVNGNQLSGLSSYVLLRSEGGTGSFVVVDTVGADTLVYTDENLKALTVYEYAVLALDESGNTGSRHAPVKVRTGGIDAPSRLQVESRIGRIVLSWSASEADELRGYNVYRTTSSDGEYERLEGVEGASFTTGNTAFVDSNIVPGQLYFYRVEAVGGDDLRSSLSAFIGARALEDEIPPAVPQNLSVVVQQDSIIVLRWSAPVEDANGGDLTGLDQFVILRSEGDENSFVAVDTVSANTLEYMDLDLETMTLYTYALIALDEEGNASTRSRDVHAQTGGVAAPEDLLAIGEIGRVVLSWRSSTDAELLGYRLYRAEESDGEYLALGDEGALFTTGQTAYIDSSLSGGRQFFYKVSSVTERGESPQSAFVGTLVLEDEVGPAAPQNLSVTVDDGERGRVVLRWSAPLLDADGGRLTGLSNYLVLRAEEGNGYFVVVGEVESETREYVDEGLEPLSLYAYAIVAVDSAGNESVLSIGREVRTGGVAVPGGLQARSGIGRIVLTWFDSAEEDLQGYNVYRSRVSGAGYERLGLAESSFTTGQTSYVDESVDPGAEYFYKISAVTSAGESELSVFVGAEVLPDDVGPGVPQDLRAQVSQDAIGQVVLRWTAPLQDADGGELTGLDRYVVLRRAEGFGALASVATLSADALEAAEGILGSGVVEYVDRDLEPLTVYEYSVIAIDAAGNESSQATSVQVQSAGIKVPVGLQAVGGFRRVTLTWQASDEEDLLGYNVYSADSSDSSDEDYERLAGDGGTFTTGLTTFVHTELTTDEVRYYRITAVTARGESQRSAFVGVQVE